MSRVLHWPARFDGLGAFGVVWLGQVATLVGTAATRLAFVVVIWTTSGSAADVVLLSLATFLPRTLMTPSAGAIVDRCNRGTAMQIADIGGLIAVGLLTLVYYAGDLQTWQIYVTLALGGLAEAFQLPAFAAAVPQLVRRDQLQTANALVASARGVADVGGPPLGAALFGLFGLGPVLLGDLLTFVLALACIRLARMRAATAVTDPAPRPRLLADSFTGLRYLLARPSLRSLLSIFFVVSLTTVFGFAILQPMVLARTEGNATVLAVIDGAIGAGGIVGGVLMAVWGGPKNRVRVMLLGIMGCALFAQVGVSIGRTATVWAVAGLIGATLVPLVNSSFQAILQAKVPPALQGRVFGAFFFMMQIAALLAMCLSGPLADRVFEPPGAAEPRSLGTLVGHGSGSGLATMLFLAGVCAIVAAAVGLMRHRVRRLDELLPDLDPAADVYTVPTISGAANERT